jgi:hypothetical protein
VDGSGLYLEVRPNGVKAWRYRFELRDGALTNFRYRQERNSEPSKKNPLPDTE